MKIIYEKLEKTTGENGDDTYEYIECEQSEAEYIHYCFNDETENKKPCIREKIA